MCGTHATPPSRDDSEKTAHAGFLGETRLLQPPRKGDSSHVKPTATPPFATDLGD